MAFFKRDELKYFVEYMLVRIAVAWIQWMPINRCERYTSLFASIIHFRFGLRKELIVENLRRVFPEWSNETIDETSIRMWRHLLLMCCEIAHAPRKIHRTNWFDFYVIPDRQKILRFVLDPRPKIFVSGHFGNFELGGFLNGLFGLPSSTIARPLDNRFLHVYLEAFRSRGGQHFIDKDGSADQIQRLLESGGTLSMLADQDAGNKGCWVSFLGSPASCHKALALFTLSNNAPMSVVTNRRLDRPSHFRLEVEGIIDPRDASSELLEVQSLTQWYNDRLESSIRSHPEQYWWVHRRWRDPPPRIQKQLARVMKC